LKKFTFWLSLCLALALTLALWALQPVSVEAASAVTVYLDPAAGNDSADGLTEATAMKTFEKAWAKVKSAGSGTIVFLSDLVLTTETRLPSSASTVPVTLTSKTGAEGITNSDNIRFNTPTTLENITMTLSKASSSCGIYGEGKALVIGEDVTSVGTANSEGSMYYFNLSGGKRWASCSSADLTVKSGTWRNIYVGTYGYSSGTAKVTGNAKLTMTGGTLTGFITPAYSNSATIGGDVDIYLSNMQATTIYSSPAYTATVAGDVNVTLGEGAVITGSVFTGGLGSGSITGNMNITLDGADTTGYDKIKKGGGSDYTGSVGSATITLKQGVVNTPITGFDTTAINIPEGKTLKLLGQALTADTVQSAGTLAFEGAARLTAKAVTGTVNCVITDTLRSNNAYVTAPAGSNFVFEGGVLTEKDGVWVNEDLNNFQGLVLSHDEGVTVTLYSGFATDTLIEPFSTNGNTQYYANVSGKYRVVAKRTGYITVSENIYVSPEEVTTRMEKHYSLVKREKAWDPEYVRKLTDEVLTTLCADINQWPEYAAAFTTPVFTEGRSEHKYTTQEEMETFIAGLDTDDDKMYVYSLGTTQGTVKFNIPLVIFTETDLSGAETLEEAAALIDGNGKLTVHYQGQVHGNEPAGGEAALGMIAMMDTEYGDNLLDKLNVYIIPRLNPDGAYQDKRVIPNVSKDPNRDYTNLETYEVRRTVYAMNLFHPEAVVDGHEYTVRLESTSTGFRDVLIHSERSAYSTEDFVTHADGIGSAIFANMEANNLTYGWYNNYLGGASSNIGTSYTMQRGYYSVLLESHGIYAGTYNMARRVASHVISMDGVLQYLHENAEAANKAVNDQWDKLVEDGKKYGDGDQLTLKVTSQPYPSLDIPNAKTLNLVTGEVTVTGAEAKAVTLVQRSRENPTAYLIPADHEKIDYILEHVAAHGLTYYTIPAGASVMAQHVGGDTTEAIITEEQKTVFPNGAYVFGMDQRYARLLGFLMEPDVNQNAEYESSFAQAGVVTLENGEYPVYRYVRNLNSESKIDYEVIPAAPEGLTGTAPTEGNNGVISGLDASKLYEYCLESSDAYTAVPAGSTQITGLAEGKYYVRLQATATVDAGADAVVVLYGDQTVYVDQTNGSDDNDGYSEAAPVKTINQAYAQLSARLDGSDATGTVMFLSDYALTAKVTNLPSHDFPVVLTSKTGAEGLVFTYTPSSGNTNGEINLNGPTTFKKMIVINNGKDTYVYLTAGGHKLVIEEDVEMTTGNKKFMFAGGRKDGSSTNVDVTLKAAYFDVIYLATHTGTHNGPIQFSLLGGAANTMTPSYNGTVTGDVTINMENAKVSNIYLGNTSKNNFTGNVDITLGEGATFTNLYTGSRDAGNIVGTATVTVDGADLTGMNLYGKAKNAAGTVTKSVLVYKSGTLGTYSNFTEFVDASVQVLRGDMNGDGVVTDADALYLLRHTLFADRYPIDQSGDVNGDGDVTDADALYLLRFTLFPERYPLQ